MDLLKTSPEAQIGFYVFANLHIPLVNFVRMLYKNSKIPSSNHYLS